MKTHLEQLKFKYNDVQKAYKEYTLSKTLLHQIRVSENAPKEIKDIVEIQNILNEYCINFIENEPCKELHEFFGFSDNKQLIDFIFSDQNFEKLDFLEIQYEFRDSILSGEYQNKLIQESKSFTWEKLEKLIIKENNNQPKLLDIEEIDKKLKKIIKDFGLVSITIGNAKVDEELIKKTYQSLEQLSIVLECDKKHIGLNKLNLCLDGNSEVDLYSGYVDRFKSKHLKLYVISSVMNETLAHEWFHFLDIVTAEYKYRDIYGEKISQYRLWESEINPSFKHIIKKAEKIINNLSIEENKVFSNIEKIINKYSKLNTLNDEEGLKAVIKKEFANKDNYLDKNNLILEIQKFQINKNTGLIPYILSEIDMLSKKSPSKSIFSQYAEFYDKNMKEIGLLHKDGSYSTTTHEVVARIFESYTDVKLLEKGLSNIISKIDNSFYTPQKDEFMSYIKDFKAVIGNMKVNFNKIFPIDNKNTISEKIFHLRETKEILKNHKKKSV